MSDPDQQACRNHLLRVLPAETFARIAPDLRHEHLSLRDVLVRPGVPIATAYFVEDGYVSLLVPLEDGDVSEVGLIGPEGLVGHLLVYGSDQSITEALVQAEGAALAIDAAALRRLLAELPALRERVLLYALALGTQVALTAACNGHHPVEQRLARWLLMAHDRVEGDELVMTHEFLAMMLGVRRAGITVAARALQAAGLIHYRTGRITVLDRPGLEAAACECHDIARRETRRLLGS